MELRAGYKQTEIGVIPEDWDMPPLGSLFSFKNGLNKAKEFFGYGTPIVNYMDVFEKAGLRINDVLGRVDVNRNELRAYDVRRGDVFFTRTSETVEEIGIASVMLDEPRDTVFSGFVLRARPFDDSLDNEFKKYCFTARYFRQQVTARASYTTRALTNGGSLAATSVARPSLPEQRAIAAALSDADALIASLDALIAKKRDLKQAAMQQLLTGKTRLPGFKEKWAEQSLFDLANNRKELFDDGDWVESEHITDKGIRLVQTGNVGIGSFVEKDDKKYIFEESFASLRCKEIQEGDLLICRLAEPAGRACVLPNIGEEKIVTSVDVTIFRPAPNVANRVFLASLFSTNPWFRAVSDRSGGTTHKRISRGSLGRIKISIPPVEEQSAIAAILSDMDAELAALEAKHDKAQALKQGMMQELLTGRIRLV